MGPKIFSLLIVGLFVYVASPLLLPIAMAAVFAVLFFPLLEKLERRKIPTVAASALLTTAITVVVLLPAATLIFLSARIGLEQLRVLRDAPKGNGDFFENLASSPGFVRLTERISGWYPIQVDEAIQNLRELAQIIALRIADALGSFFTALPTLSIAMIIMIISIYFFLVDGRRLVFFVRQHSFFNATQTERLIRSFAGMCRSVILATVVSGFVQALIFFTACLIAGIGQAPLLGFLVLLASFIPLLGSAPITFGVAIQQLVIGQQTTGIIFIVVAIVVAMIDNFIRPIVLKGGGNLHPLLAFIAAFGGLQTFGFLGVFLGPIIASLFVVTIDNLTRSDTSSA
jgi:predicted PurR-regulated permease PerM